MFKSNELCLDLCQQFVNSSGIDSDDFTTTSYQNQNEKTVLELSNRDFDITFHLVSEENKNKGIASKELFHFETEDCITYLHDVSVKGYYSPRFGELNQKQLLSIFKSLAKHHSKFINENKTNKDVDVFQSEQSQNLLKQLYKQTESIGDNDIDVDIFKQGVTKLIEVLQPTNKFCIKASNFQKKILFKDNDLQFSECILLNLGKGRQISNVYDMLSLIYSLTDQKQRQKYFHEIISHYYKVMNDEFNVNLDLEEYEQEIKSSIPYVKLELVLYYLKQQHVENNLKNDYKKLIHELVWELYEHVVAPRINREDCYKIIMNAMGTNYDSLSFKVVEQEGILGILGEYSKLEINVTEDDGSIKEFHLFAKHVPKDMVPLRILFSREEFIYITFTDELKKLGLEGITDFLPKCYFVRPGDVIMLEDVSYSNYRSLECNEPFSYEMLQLAVKQLAKMHACSLLYEEMVSKVSGEEVRIDAKFNEYLNEMFYGKENEMAQMAIKCNVNSTVNNVFDEFPDVPQEISMEMFRERTRKMFELMSERFQSSIKYRSVICHGDVWGGNILFKFEESKVSDCCFVDYQLLRYCPPSHDLLAFLYINTDKATRIKYMHKLQDEYYEELLNIFKRYDFDLNKIYPYDHYVECLEYMRPQAVCLAAVSYPFSLDREKLQDLLSDPQKKMYFFTTDKTDVLKELMKDNRIRLRFREIVEDLYDLCLKITE